MQAHALTRCDHSCSPQVARDKALMPERSVTCNLYTWESWARPSRKVERTRDPGTAGPGAQPCPHQLLLNPCPTALRATLPPPTQRNPSTGTARHQCKPLRVTLAAPIFSPLSSKKSNLKNYLNVQDTVPFIYRISKIMQKPEGSTQTRFSWKRMLPLMHFIGIRN